MMDLNWSVIGQVAGSVTAIAGAAGYALRLVLGQMKEAHAERQSWWEQQTKRDEALTTALTNHLSHDEDNLTKIAEALGKIVTILEERRPVRVAARRKG